MRLGTEMAMYVAAADANGCSDDSHADREGLLVGFAPAPGNFVIVLVIMTKVENHRASEAARPLLLAA